MGNVQSSIQSSFHGSEDPVACCGSSQTHVQETSEGVCPVTHVLNIVVLSCSLRLTFVLVRQFQLTQYLFESRNISASFRKVGTHDKEGHGQCV